LNFFIVKLLNFYGRGNMVLTLFVFMHIKLRCWRKRYKWKL